jgi:putative membrane protein
MLRTLRYILIGLVGLMIVIFSLSNTSRVLIKAMPDDLAAFFGVSWQIELPLFLVMLGGVVAGLLIGFVWEWLREHKHRATARTKSKEVSKLERELSVMRDSNTVPQDDIIALLDAPKPR